MKIYNASVNILLLDLDSTNEYYLVQAKLDNKWTVIFTDECFNTADEAKEFAVEYATGEDAGIEMRVVKMIVSLEIA